MKGLVLILILAASLASRAQESDLDVVKRCVKLGIQLTCAMANVTLRAQLQIASECNNGILAKTIANSCTRNEESGIFCAEATYYATDVAAQLGTCASAIAGGNCSSDCKAGLQNLRNELGCCITNIFNNTDSAFTPYLSVFSDSLWSRCGLGTIGAPCAGELTYILNRQRTCTYSEILSQFLPIDCEDYRNPRVRQQTNCEPFFSFLDDYCSLNERGNFCLETDPATDFTRYITPLSQANCFTDPTVCLSNPNCSSIFEQFVGDRGCCINAIYNSTYGEVFGLNQMILENGTRFSQCRLQTPSRTCRTYSPPGNGSLKLGGLTFLLLIPMIIISLTVN